MIMNGLKRLTAGLVVCLLSATAPALSPPPPQPDDHLLPALYEAFDGDNWINNDGWLDPEVHWCDWHGVTCGEEYWPGFFDFSQLDLSGNNLRGQFSEALFDFFQSALPEDFLDLSNNQISGPLSVLPIRTRVIDFSGNRLVGPLPSPPFVSIVPGGGPVPLPVEILDLSNNQFSGSIPPGWSAAGNGFLSLGYLNLSGNQFDGTIRPAVRAMGSETLPGGAGLWLADNAFSGEIDPAWFENLDLAVLNLCWTDLEISDPELDAWIAERHWGGDPALCLGRERLALDPTISGSWYDVNRPGEGLSLMLLEDGTPLTYWFSHISWNRQFWSFNTGQSEETTLRFDPLLRTRGIFGEGFSDVEFPLFRAGSLRLDRVDTDQLHAEFSLGYQVQDLAQPDDIVVFVPLPESGLRADHAQLTRLAGTTCDNQLDHQWISGAWYDPERGGEGFVVEVIEDGRGVVYWFTYPDQDLDPVGPYPSNQEFQAWLTGDGQFAGTTLTINPIYRPQDTGFLMPGSIEAVENFPVGELKMEFIDQDHALIQFISTTPDFPSISHAIERLARPMLADCGG